MQDEEELERMKAQLADMEKEQAKLLEVQVRLAQFITKSCTSPMSI